MESEDLEAMGVASEKDRRQLLQRIKTFEWRAPRERRRSYSSSRPAVTASTNSHTESDDGSGDDEDEETHSASDESSSAEEETDSDFGNRVALALRLIAETSLSFHIQRGFQMTLTPVFNTLSTM